jgi:hypothetical protein
MANPTDEHVEPPAGSAWPAVDPDTAVKLLLHEAERLALQARLASQTAPVDDSILRDLSPLGR